MICNIFKVNGYKYIGKLIISILITEGIGALSVFLGMSDIGTYMSFKKPSFSPPGWIFPIVWAILYLLMAIAAYRIWACGKQGKDVKKALILYGIQLALSFFGQLYFLDLDFMV